MRNSKIKKQTPAIDYTKLLTRMAERRYTRKTLAKQIGISESTFDKSICQGTPIQVVTIMAASLELAIPTEDIPEYFFNVVSK